MPDANDFLTAFAESEIKPVTLKSMEGRNFETIHIRKLSWNDKQRFHVATKKMLQRLIVAIEKDDKEAVWDSHVDHSDKYLIKKSMCEPDGTLIWDDSSKLEKWLDSAGSEVVEEILTAINEFSGIYGSLSANSDDSIKKNSELLDEILQPDSSSS